MILRLEHINLEYQRSILKNINATIYEGDIVGIIGKSGAGKSSLLKIMAGLLQATSGFVYYRDEPVEGPAQKLVPGHPDIQLVNQDFQLDTYHTLEENIREQILYLPAKQRDRLTEDLLHLLDLNDLRIQKAHTLSGGEQQRLSIARALAKEPKILILDEPFVHLDNRLKSRILNYLLLLHKTRKTTLILVSHDGADILSIANRILYLNDGQISRKGHPINFYYKPQSIKEARLLGTINSVKLKNKQILFRPDEYLLEENHQICTDYSIDVNYSHSLFNGMTYENYMITSNNETIVLYSLKPLINVTQITIRKKSISSESW